MDNRNLSDIITESDCELIENELSGFGKGARLDEKTEQHILSSVMGKAGFKMDNRINHTKKYSRRFIGFMAAAAIAVTGIAGAGAAYVLKNRSIDSYYGAGAADELESRGLVDGTVYKGEHFDITIETVMSDGHVISLVASAAPNDEAGEKLLANKYEPELHSDTALTAALPHGEITGFNVEDGYAKMSWGSFFDTSLDSMTVPIEARYFNYPENRYEKIASFDITFAKNLDSITLINDKGETALISDIGFFSESVTLDNEYKERVKYDEQIEYNDGTVLDMREYAASSEAFDRLYDRSKDEALTERHENFGIAFFKLIDHNKVRAVTIGGTRFEVK